MKTIWAVRGGTTVPRDEALEIIQATEELLQTIFKVNRIQAEDIVSIIFTVTHDIISEFPAVAARNLGLTDTPLICTQEIPKPGSLSLCIRVLILFYTELNKAEIKPIYLRDAVKLRPDLINK